MHNGIVRTRLTAKCSYKPELCIHLKLYGGFSFVSRFPHGFILTCCIAIVVQGVPLPAPFDEANLAHMKYIKTAKDTFTEYETELFVQVRCIAEVLRLVGSGLERPEVIREMLDISTNPGRPQYPLAAETPLLLHSAGFPDHLAPQFRISPLASASLRGKVRTSFRSKPDWSMNFCNAAVHVLL